MVSMAMDERAADLVKVGELSASCPRLRFADRLACLCPGLVCPGSVRGQKSLQKPPTVLYAYGPLFQSKSKSHRYYRSMIVCGISSTRLILSFCMVRLTLA